MLRGLGLLDAGMCSVSEDTHVQACYRWGGAPDP